MDDAENIYTNLEIDPHTLDVVTKAIMYLVDNPNIVDWAIPYIPHYEELKTIAELLTKYVHHTESAIIIPMTQLQWDHYISLIEYVGTVIPSEWKEEAYLLEELSDKYDDIDKKLERI